MRLFEFQGSSSRQLTSATTSISRALGTHLQRVGNAYQIDVPNGPRGRVDSRFYRVDGEGKMAAAFVIANTVHGLALAYDDGAAAAGITTIYYWNVFNISNKPDFALDIPLTVNFDEALPVIASWIKAPRLGKISMGGSTLMEARRCTADEFMSMAQAKFGASASKLSLSQLDQLAKENDVQIPMSIRGNPELKIDAHHWNLGASDAETDNEEMSKTLGGPVEDATQAPEEYNDLMHLAKVKSLSKLAEKNKVYLMGRKANGAFFTIPGVEEILAQVQRIASQEINKKTGREDMSVQFDKLAEQVKLIAGGKSQFIKSLLITGAPSSGKALALDTAIPTPTGWTTMGDLKVGDTIYDDQGKPCKVTFATPIQYNRECYNVKFDDGTEIVADAEHRWATQTQASRQSERRNKKRIGEALKPRGTDQSHKRIMPGIVNTKEIAETLYAREKFNHSIVNTKPIETIENNYLPVSPYVFGLWLGDGCASSATLTCGDSDVQELSRLLTEEKQDFKLKQSPRNVWTVQLSNGQGGKNKDKIRYKLREMNVFKNKHIPVKYLRASIDDRMALLQGLMDTDGYISKNGCCEFSVTNKQLATDVHELLSGLGIKASVHTSRAKIYGVDKGERYRIHFTTSLPVFRFERKLERINKNIKRPVNSRTIIGCEKIASVPVRCITVDSPSHLFLCSRSFIPTHNTFTVMKEVKALGLVAGRDYIVKKGRITAHSMFRTLIEQINGMVIFDDCDSVAEDKNGINMLKGALDTDPVREISYDVRGGINTGAMGDEERDTIVNAISRVLRGKPTPEDMERLKRYLKPKKAKKSRDDDDDYEDDIDDDDDFVGGAGEGLAVGIDQDMLYEMQELFARKLPNKIDFKGRIIFISNMLESEWDSAILTRAFTVNMSFTSGEMLDYIDGIKQHIKTPNLSDEEKQEVMDYLRQRYIKGAVKRDINFRIVQQCFDLRLTDSWKKLIDMM